MICYAKTHRDGAKKLQNKYNLRKFSYKRYISTNNLQQYVDLPGRDILLKAIQQHPEIHAYVLPSLKMYFHPDTLLPIIGGAYEEYFRSLL